MKQYRRRIRTSVTRRRGAVMVAAMICLLLATVLLGSVLKMAITGRKQVRREQWRLQAAWLAEAGLERAASRLSAGAVYQGETWNIAATDLDGRHTGQVVIKVEAPEGSATTRLVTVEAVYPSGSITFAKKTLRATVGQTPATRKDAG